MLRTDLPAVVAMRCLLAAAAVVLVMAAGAAEDAPGFTNSIGMRMVAIPAGEFRMGSAEDAEAIAEAFAAYGRPASYFADEFPRHDVRITKPFQLGRYEVTVGEFGKFVAATGYRTEAERDGSGGWGYDAALGRCLGRDRRFTWRDPGFEQSPRHPVLNVTWNDARAFCDWLTKQEGRTYRLPTEAEWEYACRAGTATRYSCGDDPALLLRTSRTLDPAGRDVKLHVQDVPIPGDGPLPFTVPVGSYPGNAFGLCDMHGNVWEWVADWYGEREYDGAAAEDPTGPAEGNRRVRRGGAWNSYPLWARASFRNWNSPSSRCLNLGFRVAADADLARRRSPPGSLSVVFVGDVMLDNGPGNAVAAGRDPFAACAGLLLDGDFTVGNLECVLGRGGEQRLKNYTFRAAEGSPDLLAKYFSAVSLANNHALDFGPEGLVEMLAILSRAGIPQVGGGGTLAEARRPLVLERNGIRVALLACNAIQAERSAAAEASPGVAPLREDDLLADIAAAAEQADAVVPFVHWGPELVAAPRDAQRALARRMVEAGAAAVIGAHPHITQTVDAHRGVPIVYSLGNFVFDYYPVDPPEWTGWVAKLTFAKGRPADLETSAVVLDPAGIPRPLADE